MKLPWRRLRGQARWLGRPSRWVLGTAATLVVLLAVIDLLADEPLRRQMEQKLNARLHGYTVRILAADFHVLGCGLDLKDVVIVQQANPDPPVARIARLSASVEWKALVFGRIVADVRFDRPVVFLNFHQVIQNAFFEAILPGFEQQLKRLRSGSAARETRRS